MNRRNFLGLTAGLVRQPRPEPQAARWRFGIDPRGRWSLARGGQAPIRNAEIAVQLRGEERFTLGALEDLRRIRTGSRRTGEGTWTVVGTHGAIEVSAQFDDD